MRTFLTLAPIALIFSLAACPAEEPPPLSTPEVGLIVGEVFASDGTSLGGASVEVYGSSSKVVSTAGKQFVLEAIPKGKHDVIITSGDGLQAVRTQATIEQRYQTVYLRAEDTTLAQVSLQGHLSLDSGSPAGAFVYLVGGNSHQVTSVGDDGNYSLDALPTGTVQIAYSKSGYDNIIKDMNLNTGENSAEDVSLVSSSVDNLSISGTARLDGETDHRGITVLLNGGEQVASSDEKGAYHFSNLAPGVYSLRAQAPGHRSVELGAVALDASGEAHGLVDLFLAQGSDEAKTTTTGPSEHSFVLSISSPLSGQVFEKNQEVVLLAEARYDEQPFVTQINWSYTNCSAEAEPIAIDTGNPLTTTTLPLGNICLSASATSPEGVRQSVQRAFEIVPIAVDVHIISQETNDPVLATVPTGLSAEVTVRDGVLVEDQNLHWSYRVYDSGAAFTDLGTGLNNLATFAAVNEETVIELKVDVSVEDGAGQSSDSVLLRLMPLHPAMLINADYAAIGVDLPSPTAVHGVDGDHLSYEIFQGQPVVLSVVQGADMAQSISWQSDTGFLFSGSDADLSVLGEGLHKFALVVTGDNGLSGQSEIWVTVHAFTFSIGVSAPEIEPQTPYFVSQGLPLKLIQPIAHPYQRHFEWSKVRWFDSRLGQIATGWDTRTYALPAGPGVIRVEVEDATGNVATAWQEYALQEIDFSAQILTPDTGLDVLEGTPVDFNASYTHSLVPSVYAASDVRMHYFSSIQGLLTDTTDKSEFLPDETATFSDLVPGHHIITLRVSLGNQFTEAQRAIDVHSPGISAALISPEDETMFFADDAVKFQIQETHDVEVHPKYSWYLDGQEFDASWGGYGSDDTAASRSLVDLGTYDPVNAPFNDARWSDGSHEVKFFMRLPEVDPNLGCVNIPSKAVCIRLRVHIAPANADICASDNTDFIIDSGDIEVWSGVRRLNCKIYIRNQGQLIVQPGARILVDATGSASQRGIILQSGSLQVGSPDAVDEVIFQVQGSRVGPSAWNGFTLGTYNYTGASEANFDHVTIRHANAAFRVSSYWNSSDRQLKIHNSRIEDSENGLKYGCADELSDTTFSNISDDAISESNFYNCHDHRTYQNLRFLNVHTGLYLRDKGEILLSNIEMDAVSHTGVSLSGGYDPAFTLQIENSLFNNVNGSNSSAIDFSGCTLLKVHNSTFTNNDRAIYTHNCTVPGDLSALEIIGNVFAQNANAISEDRMNRVSPEVHLNSFVDNSTNIKVSKNGKDINAQGNYFGPIADPTTTGGASLALDIGRMTKLPGISDLFNDDGGTIVRVDNVLRNEPGPVSPLPVAYIREPQRSQAYNANRCIPMQAESPIAGIDASANGASDALCHWWLDGDENNGTEVFADTEGCMDTSQTEPVEGPHQLLLTCQVRDETNVLVRTDRHMTDFLVDNSAIRGRQWRLNETWPDDINADSDIYVDGDIVVPAHHSLTIKPGTHVYLAGSDRLHHRVYPNWEYGGAPNTHFGLHSKIDFFVTGDLQAHGDEQNEISFSAESGLDSAEQWGGFRVRREGTLRLEHTVISGASIVLHGEYKGDDVSTLPKIYFDNNQISGVSILHRGSAPMHFVGNSGEHIVKVFDNCMLPKSSFSIDDNHFEKLGNTSSVKTMLFDNYAKNGPGSISIAIYNSDFMRIPGNRRDTGLYTNYDSKIDNILFSGGSFENYDKVFTD